MVTGCDRQRTETFSLSRQTVCTQMFCSIGVFMLICGPILRQVTVRGPPALSVYDEVALARPYPRETEVLLSVSPLQSKIQYAHWLQAQFNNELQSDPPRASANSYSLRCV